MSQAPSDVAKSWKPYSDAQKELPVTHFMPQKWYEFRWKIVKPFNTQVAFGWSVGEFLTFLIFCAYAVVLCYNCYSTGDQGFSQGTTTTTTTTTNTYPRGGGGHGGSNKQSGSAVDVPIVIMFAFAMRNSVWTFILGISYERQLFWHKFLAYMVVAMGIYHWALNPFNTSGFLTILPMMITLVISQTPIRRYVFDFFYRMHWILFVFAAVFGLIHGSSGLVIGFILFLIDEFLRCLVVYRNKNIVKVCKATRLPCNIVRLTFPKANFQYKAGQYVFINIPSLSYLEWHPFSFSSSPYQQNVTVHIRVLGDWTKQLYNLVAQEMDLKIYVEGPYGQPEVDLDDQKYQHYVFFTGGIGITPMQSITNQFLYEYNIGRKFEQLVFVWTVRDRDIINAFEHNAQNYLESEMPSKLPAMFQPNLLNSEFNAQNWDKFKNLIDLRIHLTEKKAIVNNNQNINNNHVINNIINNQNQEVEMQKINYYDNTKLNQARPDIKAIIQQVVEKAAQSPYKNVAVMSCGPSQMIEEIAKHVKSLNGTQGVHVDHHSEVFEF